MSNRVMFIVYCVCQTESLHCAGLGAGLTKGTASNKDLRSQKLHSEAAGEARGGCGGEWSLEINSSSQGISLTAERSGGTSNCHPVLSHRFPPRVNHS